MKHRVLRRILSIGWLMASIALLPACTLEVGVEQTAEAAHAGEATETVSPTPRTPTPTTARPTATRRPSVTPSPTSSPTALPTRAAASQGSGSQSDVSPTPSPLPPPTNAPTATPTVTPTPLPTAPSASVSIDSFEADSLTVRAGWPLTLSWAGAGTSFAIQVLLPDGSVAETYDGLASEGTLTIPIERDVLGELTVVLNATGGGQASSREIPIQVICTADWFFSRHPAGCPAWPEETYYAAGQFFEHGFMIWRSDVAEITVFHANGAYAVYPDTWTTGMPESDPEIVPPEGFYQPIRGFGLVWRERPSPLGGLVREHLGWSIARYEVEYTGEYQCEAESSAGGTPACFVRAPDGSVIRMVDGAWDNWQSGL